jgi:predicted pyridoxine 5'-phosphate oxidase superfamily flavin-nucleotide-binding protein
MLNNDIREIIEKAKLAFVATVCADGSPNLSPKGSLRVYDDSRLVFMDIASPTTMENLRRDPRLEVCVVDFFSRRGYRFKGRAQFAAPGDKAYEWLNDWLLEVNGPGYPANEVVIIDVAEVLPVLSPAYTWGGANEGELSASWQLKYQSEDVPESGK